MFRKEQCPCSGITEEPLDQHPRLDFGSGQVMCIADSSVLGNALREDWLIYWLCIVEEPASDHSNKETSYAVGRKLCWVDSFEKRNVSSVVICRSRTQGGVFNGEGREYYYCVRHPESWNGSGGVISGKEYQAIFSGTWTPESVGILLYFDDREHGQMAKNRWDTPSSRVSFHWNPTYSFDIRHVLRFFICSRLHAKAPCATRLFCNHLHTLYPLLCNGVDIARVSILKCSRRNAIYVS